MNVKLGSPIMLLALLAASIGSAQPAAGAPDRVVGNWWIRRLDISTDDVPVYTLTLRTDGTGLHGDIPITWAYFARRTPELLLASPHYPERFGGRFHYYIRWVSADAAVLMIDDKGSVFYWMMERAVVTPDMLRDAIPYDPAEPRSPPSQ